MEKARCDSCRKELLKARFSDTAWRKHKESVVRNQRNSKVPVKYPRCKNCSPQARQEMRCTKCNLVKGLDDFSKRQRTQTDVAECKDCVQEREDRMPNHDEAVEEEIIIEEIKRMEIQSSFPRSNASRLTSANPSRISGQSVSDRYETDTNPASESWVHGNDAISVGGSEYTTGTIASRRPITGTDWDNFDGDNRIRKPASQTSRDRFVKQNAVPKSQTQRAQEQLDRERNRQRFEDDKLRRADSDEGSDDDDDEDPY